MKKVNITRAVYKDIKRYDHNQMNEFLTDIISMDLMMGLHLPVLIMMFLRKYYLR